MGVFDAVYLMPAPTVQVAKELGFRDSSDCIGILSSLAEEAAVDGMYYVLGWWFRLLISSLLFSHQSVDLLCLTATLTETKEHLWRVRLMDFNGRLFLKY